MIFSEAGYEIYLIMEARRGRMITIWPKALKYLLEVMHEPPRPVPAELKPNKIEDPLWVEEMRKQKDNLLFYYGAVDYFSESKAYTVERHSLWRHNASNVPIALKGAFQPDELKNISREKICGDLLLLKEGALADLDFEMGLGVNFIRKAVNVIVPLIDCEGNPTRLVAWMYVGTDAMRDKIVWDANFYKSTGGKDFSLAQKLEDPRRWIGKYYKHQSTDSNGEDYKKCFLHLHKGLDDPAPPAPKPADPPPIRIQLTQAIHN